MSESIPFKAPRIYHIPEKQKKLAYFDMMEGNIKFREIESERPIPEFMSTGRVLDRIFVFGGKDKITKSICNFTLEIVPCLKNKEESFKTVERKRMPVKKSRAAVASLLDKFIVLIGGEDT